LRYDDGSLRQREEERETKRLAQAAEFKANLVDGPVVVLPLGKGSGFQFNPQTLVPLDGFGMIYPTMRLTDRWGSLEVESGGALIRDTPRQATVSANAIASEGLSGAGWKLTLEPGWSVRAGARKGDFLVQCQKPCEE
jgi:hypothetical protein